jgi:hypothetical protein
MHNYSSGHINSLKQLKAELAALLEQEAKAHVLRRLPLFV